MNLTFEELLEIEDDGVLNFRCPNTGVLIWPLLRNQFFRILISRLYYNDHSLITSRSSTSYIGLIRLIPKVLWHNFKNINYKKSDVMIFSTGVGNFSRDGLWFNRISDYFSTSCPNTLNVEGIVNQSIPEPRHQKKTYYWLLPQILLSIYGRFFTTSSHKKLAADIVNYVAERADMLLEIKLSQHEIDLLMRITAPKIARIRLALGLYRNFLKKVSPKLIIVEEACYGHMGLLNLVAHDMGIRVAEMQHGMVSAGHDAYCFSEDIIKSEEYRNYLPDDFLGYGYWWNKQINVPAKKWEIGNPHYSIQKAIFDNVSLADKRDVLLLSDGFEFEKYLDLALKLTKIPEFHHYRIVLRPHPLERDLILKKHPNGRVNRVIIDEKYNVYQSLSTSHVVLGEVSTVLFEAVGLVNNIYIWKTPKAEFSYPAHPFQSFTSIDEFVEKFFHQHDALPDRVVHAIWADGWQKNYLNYLEKVL